MELWQALLVALGGNAALLLVLGYVGRSIFNHALNKALEKFKGQLQLAAKEHEIRFSKLHEKRAEVIAELYKLLTKAAWEAESFTSRMDWVGKPGKKEKYILAAKAIDDYFLFFDQHRIYLSSGLCGQLEEFADKLRTPVTYFGIWVSQDNLEGQDAIAKDDAWDTAWNAIKNNVPNLKVAIELEFRTLLGANDHSKELN